MTPTILNTVVLYLFATACLSRAEQYYVSVGQFGNVFSPSEVTASSGDVIIFVFYSGLITVNRITQSHNQLTVLLANQVYLVRGISVVEANESGAWSGFMPVTSVERANYQLPVWSMDVTSSQSSWYYGAGGSNSSGSSNYCHTGMVFCVNPTEQETYDGYQQQASSATVYSLPTYPAEGGVATWTAAQITTAITAPPTSASTEPVLTAAPPSKSAGSRTSVAGLSALLVVMGQFVLYLFGG